MVITVHALIGSAKHLKSPTSNGLLAQLVEQVTLNHRVGGSSPSQPTYFFFTYPFGHTGLAAVTFLISVPLTHVRVLDFLVAVVAELK